MSPPSSFPDRPPPKRLPAGRAFNLRRSVLGAIGKVTAISQCVNTCGARFVRKLRHSSLRRHSRDPRPGSARRFVQELLVHAKMHRDRLASVRSPDRPPPKRLPLGGPSTSGAPSSVQLGDYGLPEAPSRTPTTQMPLFATFSLQTAHTCVESHVLYLKRTKDSPSRVRFRPLSRLTFRFRVQPFGRASS